MLAEEGGSEQRGLLTEAENRALSSSLDLLGCLIAFPHSIFNG